MNMPEKNKQAKPKRILTATATALRQPRLVVTTGVKASTYPVSFGSLKHCMEICEGKSEGSPGLVRGPIWSTKLQCPAWCDAYMKGYPFYSPPISPKSQEEWQRLLKMYEGIMARGGIG